MWIVECEKDVDCLQKSMQLDVEAYSPQLLKTGPI